jgi:Clp amino terminal domain, pathogenicity island component
VDQPDLSVFSLVISGLALFVALYAVFRVREIIKRIPGTARDMGSSEVMPWWDEATNPRELLARLDEESRKALESAAGLMVARRHFLLDIEHWLFRLLQTENGELGQLLAKLSIPVESVSADLESSLAHFRSGNVGPPKLSNSILNLLYQAVTVAREDFYAANVRPGHVLYALLTHPALRARISRSTQAFAQTESEPLRTILCRDREAEPADCSCPACGASIAPADKRCPICQIWLS